MTASHLRCVVSWRDDGLINRALVGSTPTTATKLRPDCTGRVHETITKAERFGQRGTTTRTRMPRAIQLLLERVTDFAMFV